MVFEANRTEGIAISVAPAGMKDMMALAAQSADMLISNEDIEAAFVLYSLNDGGIGVSARSKGKVNGTSCNGSLGWWRSQNSGWCPTTRYDDRGSEGGYSR